MPDSKPLLSVIIISFNTRQMTLDCLRCLTAELAGIPAEIWVVDNASKDDSVEAIRRDFSAVRLIVNETNRGFGAANNQAMTLAEGKFFLLLNSDAFPKPGSISRLLDEMSRDPSVGMAGPALINANGERSWSPLSFYSPYQVIASYLWLHAIRGRILGIREVEPSPGYVPRDQFMSGACLLLRREVYEKLGGFNERFFFYGDDADWQFRAHRDWKLLYVPASLVTHLEGTSGSRDRLKYTLCYHEAKDLFIRIHYGWLTMIGVRLCVAIGCAMRLVRYTGRLPSMFRGRCDSDFPVRLSWHLLLKQFRPRTLNR